MTVPEKITQYKTARALIACSYFPQDACVGVRYNGMQDGIHWFIVTGASWFAGGQQHSAALSGITLRYPEHHLKDFTL